MFMHNGGIGCWGRVKRGLAVGVGERWFGFVQGATDSEWAFAVFLDCLDKAGIEPDAEPGKGGFGHSVLRKALLQTIARINACIKDVVGEEGMGSEDSRSLLNFAVTDGQSVICSRYVSSKTDEAASLFFSSGTSWKEVSPGIHADYVMERRDKGSDIVLVASEPLTFERGMYYPLPFLPYTFILPHALSSFLASTNEKVDNWVTVPTNSTLTISKQTVMIHPIVDEFYSEDPAHERSAGFARAQGQTVSVAVAGEGEGDRIVGGGEEGVEKG